MTFLAFSRHWLYYIKVTSVVFPATYWSSHVLYLLFALPRAPPQSALPDNTWFTFFTISNRKLVVSFSCLNSYSMAKGVVDGYQNVVWHQLKPFILLYLLNGLLEKYASLCSLFCIVHSFISAFTYNHFANSCFCDLRILVMVRL